LFISFFLSSVQPAAISDSPSRLFNKIKRTTKYQCKFYC
jgi:hypothetical protein